MDIVRLVEPGRNVDAYLPIVLYLFDSFIAISLCSLLRRLRTPWLEIEGSVLLSNTPIDLVIIRLLSMLNLIHTHHLILHCIVFLTNQLSSFSFVLFAQY